MSGRSRGVGTCSWSLLSLDPFGFCPQQGDKATWPQAPTAMMLFSGAWGQVTVD